MEPEIDNENRLKKIGCIIYDKLIIELTDGQTLIQCNDAS